MQTYAKVYRIHALNGDKVYFVGTSVKHFTWEKEPAVELLYEEAQHLLSYLKQVHGIDAFIEPVITQVRQA